LPQSGITTEWSRKLLEFLDNGHQQQYQFETSKHRPGAHWQNETLTTCMLFVLENSFRELNKEDVAFLRDAQLRTIVIPILGKADSLTTDELRSLKQKVVREFEQNNLVKLPNVAQRFNEPWIMKEMVEIQVQSL